MIQLLKDGKLEDREVEIEIQQSASIEGMMVPMGGMEGMDHNFTEMLQDMLPKRTKQRSVTVSEGRRILLQDELDKLVDMDEVVNEALYRAEVMGIVFLASVLQMQIVQTDAESIQVFVCPRDRLTTNDHDQILRNAREILPDEITIEVIQTDELHRAKNGKTPFIIRSIA